MIIGFGGLKGLNPKRQKATAKAGYVTPTLDFLGVMTGSPAANQVFSDVNIGDPHPRGVSIFVGMGFFNSNTDGMSAVIIDGETLPSMVLNARDSQTGSCVVAWAKLPAGGAKSVNLVATNGTSWAIQLAVFRALVNQADPVATAVHNQNNSNMVRAATLAEGKVGLFCTGTGGSNGITMTNGTLDASQAAISARAVGCGRITAPTEEVVFTRSSSSATGQGLLLLGWN